MYTKASSTYYRHNGTHPAHGTLHLPPHVLDFFTPIDPKLPHLAVDHLQPRSPLSHCPPPAIMNRLHAMPTQTGKHIPPQGGETRQQKLLRERVRIVDNASARCTFSFRCHVPSSRPFHVGFVGRDWMVDRRSAKH